MCVLAHFYTLVESKSYLLYFTRYVQCMLCALVDFGK